MRVRLKDGANVVAWHPANVTRGGHVVGVDAGNVAIFDVASYVALDARDKERLYIDHVAENAVRPLAKILSLDGAIDDCAVVESGWGDGGYPVYLGVEEGGAVVTLLIDFLLIAEFHKPTVHVPWEIGLVGRSLASPALEAAKVDVRFETTDPARATLRVSGQAFDHLRVVCADGRVLLDSSRLGCTVRGNEHIYPLGLDLRTFDHDAAIEITLHGGYRN